ncbi:MAG: DUF6152 family protein [Pseudomonadota bacterium]
MNKMIRNLSAALACALLAATAGAHHSAVAFDFAKNISYTGKVTAFTAINPHMKLSVQLPNTDGKGGTHEVKFEGHSLNNMYRARLSQGHGQCRRYRHRQLCAPTRTAPKAAT